MVHSEVFVPSAIDNFPLSDSVMVVPEVVANCLDLALVLSILLVPAFVMMSVVMLLLAVVTVDPKDH